MAARCSPPVALHLTHAQSCNRDYSYWTGKDVVAGYGHKYTENKMNQVLGAARRENPGKNEMVGSCGSAIQNVDYAPLLDHQSSRYLDKLPTVYDTVGTQAANIQVPAAYYLKGGEYADAAYMDSDTACGQSFFTYAGFAPGNYFRPDFVPDAETLRNAYLDDPIMMNKLQTAGVINTFVLGSSCAKQAGRQAALFYLYNEPTTIDRLTIDPERLIPLDVPCDQRPINPSDRISKEMSPLIGSLLSNVTSVAQGPWNESYAPAVAGVINAPAGLIRQNIVDRYAKRAWEFANAGDMNAMDVLWQRSLNGSLAFATYRAMLAKPYGSFYSGPITQSLDDSNLATSVSSMQFYSPQGATLNLFGDQTENWMSMMAP